jgi:hypothetical protein
MTECSTQVKRAFADIATAVAHPEALSVALRNVNDAAALTRQASRDFVASKYSAPVAPTAPAFSSAGGATIWTADSAP